VRPERALKPFCGVVDPASLKLASDITSDITERLFKRGIAANS
jgi:hypothetical protein